LPSEARWRKRSRVAVVAARVAVAARVVVLAVRAPAALAVLGRPEQARPELVQVARLRRVLQRWAGSRLASLRPLRL